MTRKVPVSTRVVHIQELEARPIAPASASAGKRWIFPVAWLWYAAVISAGLVIVSVVNLAVVHLLSVDTDIGHAIANTDDLRVNAGGSLVIDRTVQYAGLRITLLDAQTASVFPDDPIHPDDKTIRVHLQLVNATRVTVGTLYYDCVRLVLPLKGAIAPSNTNLLSELGAGQRQNGWLDFSVRHPADLRALVLRFGSVALDETLVSIPFKGLFDPLHFSDRLSRQKLAIPYIFSGGKLIYQLRQVRALYAYQGSQAKAGTQFYVLDFLVENPGDAVSPGLGFDYVRLIINGYDQPPLDSTLPATFKAGVQTTTGSVVFAAPADMKAITIAFRVQMGDAQQTYDVRLY